VDIIVVPFLLLIKSVIAITNTIVIADVILSWLMTANIFNTANRFVYSIIRGISQVSDYLLNPIRKRIPVNMGLDISPIIIILFLSFVDNIINRILIRLR
jgi:YggT family protein